MFSARALLTCSSIYFRDITLFLNLPAEGGFMNPLRLIGLLLLVAAVVTAVLNLHRVADLRMPWLAPLLLVFGAVFIVIAKKQQR